MNFEFLARRGVPDITPYIPGKPTELVKEELGLEGEIIKLASNENPLGISPLAKQAILDHIDECHLYPDGGGYFLRQKIAQKFDVEPDEIFLGTGSSEAIELIIKAFANRDEEIIAPEKGFAMYKVGSMIVGCKAKYIPELEGNTHDLDGIAKNISGKTKIIFIDNPSNPLGTMLTRKALENFLDKVSKNVLVVFDEAYNEYVTDADYPDSLNDFFRDMNNLIILRTFSKIYGLAGLRLGYGFAHKDVVRLINKVRQPFNTARLAQIAAIAALDDKEHIANGNITLKLSQEGSHTLVVKKIGYYDSNLKLEVKSKNGQKTYLILFGAFILVGGYLIWDKFLKNKNKKPKEDEFNIH